MRGKNDPGIVTVHNVDSGNERNMEMKGTQKGMKRNQRKMKGFWRVKQKHGGKTSTPLILIVDKRVTGSLDNRI